MIRTFIYFPETLDADIKHLASKANKSKATVIREALEHGLTTMKKRKRGGADALLTIAKLGKRINAKGPSNLSSNMDTYLWGKSHE